MHNACNFHGGGNFCSASLCLEELSFQSSIQARTAMCLTPQTLEHHPIFILSLWQILILITCRWTQRTYFSCVEVHLLAWKIKLLSASHLLPLALGTLSGNLRDALIHPGRDIRLPSIAHDHLMTHTTLMIVVSLCKHSDNGSAFWSLVDGGKQACFIRNCSSILLSLSRDGISTEVFGYRAKLQDSWKASAMSHLLKEVEQTDLVQYGLIPEFVGRFPVICSLQVSNLACCILLYACFIIVTEALIRLLVTTKLMLSNQLMGKQGCQIAFDSNKTFIPEQANA